ncbi:MAG: hypothetical protein HYV09_23140 [Deltaproteobacteria bacterium]|nr:hypothetical protein [Deltaproteobacteria bacterium]
MTRHDRWSRWAAVALVAVAAGCGGAQTGAQYDVLRPPDERTATTWIVKAFRREKLAVESGRKIQIGANASVVADVSASDKPWSVVWLRADEQQELKGKLPKPPPGVADGALWVHRGVGDDADERMLILLEQNYEYDPDPRGDKGVVRSVQEVEARTVRDVTDFLVRAKAGEIE